MDRQGSSRKKESKNKRKKNRAKAETVTPQIWLTLLWHMGLRLPWSWKMGPSDSSERRHFQETLMSWSFPANTLFLWCEVPQPVADPCTQLHQAVLDTYERQSSKTARYGPHKNDSPSAGKPKIIVANKKRKQQLEQYRRHIQNAA
jgi:hypothetical protein